MLYRKFTTTLAFCLFTFALISQDTIVIQTLTFDSITTRRGTWQFPEEGQFRKILMYHTLKCDPQTQHDPYNCGEWDYLTYNRVYDHTGVYDSTLYYQPSFTFISGKTTDSILMRSEATNSWERRVHKKIIFNDTTQLLNSEVGNESTSNNSIIALQHTDGRSQYLWKHEELIDAGFSAGEITGIKLKIIQTGTDAQHLTIKMHNTLMDSIAPDTAVWNMQTVYFDTHPFDYTGWHTFNFYNPFEWDGVSNILVEFSFEDDIIGQACSLSAELLDWNCGITSSGTDYAIEFEGEHDFVLSPPERYFNSDFTIEVWIYKHNNNTWSRVIDFGNGPNKSNVLMAFSNGSSGKLSFHVNNADGSKSMISPNPIPLNEWVHVSIRLTAHIGWMYINGEYESIGLLQQPDDTVRNINYMGRSNWANDQFADALINEMRIFNYAKEPEDIREDYNKSVSNPQNDSSLVLYYTFDDGEGTVVADDSPNALDGTCYGLPKWTRIKGPERHLDFMQDNNRPKIMFERLESSGTEIINTIVDDPIDDSPDQLELYHDPDEPTNPTDTILTFQGGYHYVYDGSEIVDSVYFGYDSIMHKELIPYYGEPFEILERYEIGRFITPYGIGLDLGPQGFTWIFDVTDYAALLQGAVDLSAGNQQELIDLKFEFIEGTPPRDVLDINRIWGPRRSYKYRDLDDDVYLSAETVQLLPEAEQFKVKSRLTGHGHYSNTGEYPHCCEWKDNTHYFYVNGEEIADWHIFQYNECAWNAVYPQGGTWPGAREGWCPGDRVLVTDIEVTEYVNADSVTFDYDITPVPENNQGMGNGNYHIAMHLIQYTDAAYDVDAEVYDVISPNDWEYYSRVNPICMDPKIIVRNNGTSAITSLTIDYGITGGGQETYNWTGIIEPNLYQEITLPIPDLAFWFGDNQNLFTVCISSPNGQQDEYTDNDCYTTHFVVPDMYNETMVLHMKMNHQAYRYSLTVTNLAGEVVFSRTGMANDSIYLDTLNLPDDCYTIELLDIENMGLTYWAYPEQGSGYFRVQNIQGGMLKNFDSEFGRSIRYSFHLGDYVYIQEPNIDRLISVYPNPAKNQINIDFDQLDGITQIMIYDIHGRVVHQSERNVNGLNTVAIDVSDLNSGLYILLVNNHQFSVKEKIIIEN